MITMKLISFGTTKLVKEKFVSISAALSPNMNKTSKAIDTNNLPILRVGRLTGEFINYSTEESVDSAEVLGDSDGESSSSSPPFP